MKTLYYPHKFPLEQGGYLPDLHITYHTFGTMNADRSNVVWVCHALTANSDVADWWPKTVEEGRFLDPAKHFVVCANIIGSCYGTTGPLETNPETGRPWYRSFPAMTIRDIVRAHILLADELGIGDISALLGCSVGGFQAVEWAVMQPERIKKLVLMATDVYASPWTVAVDETQRMAIEADKTFFADTPEGGREGLATARAIGMLTYRGSRGYNITQQDPDDEIRPVRRADTYQRYQGEKLCRRFNAYSYFAILQAFDTHNVGRGRGGIEKALASIKAKTLVIWITTDIIFTPGEVQGWAKMIKGVKTAEIVSLFGHDGFLVETDQINNILYPFINDNGEED